MKAGNRGRRLRACGAVLAVALVLFVSGRVAVSAGWTRSDLESAIALYHAARFDEALVELDRLGRSADGEGGASRDDLEECRALCLLALGRDAEAKSVVQALLERRPDHRPHLLEWPPRYAAMIREARSETWSARVKNEYRAGKASYDRKAFDAAEEHFARVVRMMNDDIDESARQAVGDAGELARAFLSLMHAAMTVPLLPPAAAAPPAPEPPRTYSSADADVIPPVPLKQELPAWNKRERDTTQAGARGQLEVIVDDRGAVEHARVTIPIHPLYDPRLLAAALSWRYQPATRNGKAVRFRKVIDVRLVQE